MRQLKTKGQVLDSMLVESEIISAAEYLIMINDRPHMVESAKIVPARLGDKSFGQFLVRYSRPFYRLAAQ